MTNWFAWFLAGMGANALIGLTVKVVAIARKPKVEVKDYGFKSSKEV